MFVQAPQALRLKVLLEALKSQRLVLDNIPENMQLLICATNFWWKYRQEEPRDLKYLHALLLGFVYGQHLHPGTSGRPDTLGANQGALQRHQHAKKIFKSIIETFNM